MFHPANRSAAPHASSKLRVTYADFDDAKRMFPNCERTALRAYAHSEARRLSNALVGPVKRWPDSFTNVVEMFADPERIGVASLISRRFDFVIMLMATGRFERRIALRLVREGKLSKAVLS